MSNLELFTLLLAIATFLLALAASYSIFQTHSIRKKDTYSHALVEVGNWAYQGLTLVSRIFRLPTTHTNYPPTWEVIVSTARMSSEGGALLSLIGKKKAIFRATKEAIDAINDCYISYKNAQPLNIKMTKAQKCELSLSKVLEVLNK